MCLCFRWCVLTGDHDGSAPDIWHQSLYWHQTESGGPTSHPPGPTWAALAACACFSCSLSSLIAWISFFSFIRLKQKHNQYRVKRVWLSLSGGGSPGRFLWNPGWVHFLSEDLRPPGNVFNLLVSALSSVGAEDSALSPSLFMSKLGPSLTTSTWCLNVASLYRQTSTWWKWPFWEMGGAVRDV